MSSTYWNLYNPDGATTIASTFFTYDTLDDMLSDDNRTSETFAFGDGRSIQGTGAFVAGNGGGGPITPIPVPASFAMLLGALVLLGSTATKRSLRRQ